jgi:hypothetical protein
MPWLKLLRLRTTHPSLFENGIAKMGSYVPQAKLCPDRFLLNTVIYIDRGLAQTLKLRLRSQFKTNLRIYLPCMT